MAFQIEPYLKRIRYDGSLSPNADTLRRLHRLHMLNVPFENLDIPLKREIKLDVDAFFDKIINRNRGGFCYELNGLFAELLRRLGFKVEMLSARVSKSAEDYGPEFDHMTLLVQLDERWIADVGFGESFIEPLKLDVEEEQIQNSRRYRIISRENGGKIYQAFDKKWMNQYLFHISPHKLREYAGMCNYHQTSPDSTFTQKVVCSRATEDGRITLTDKKLIITSGTQRQEKDLAGQEEFDQLLLEHFGFSLTE
ncbi:MAG TPA: arylamine N-acetyltransferase [Acidobacteriota bacterium]|nr:arylamine N-acetyltransferase [Acidobacteriota bacterium]